MCVVALKIVTTVMAMIGMHVGTIVLWLPAVMVFVGRTLLRVSPAMKLVTMGTESIQMRV